MIRSIPGRAPLPRSPSPSGEEGAESLLEHAVQNMVAIFRVSEEEARSEVEEALREAHDPRAELAQIVDEQRLVLSAGPEELMRAMGLGARSEDKAEMRRLDG